MQYLVIGPYCWGTGATVGAAVKRARSAMPNFLTVKKSEMSYDIYQASDDAFVNSEGNIVSQFPPKKLREVRYFGGQRTVKELQSALQQADQT